jgi:hypothetical protein
MDLFVDLLVFKLFSLEVDLKACFLDESVNTQTGT